MDLDVCEAIFFFFFRGFREIGGSRWGREVDISDVGMTSWSGRWGGEEDRYNRVVCKAGIRCGRTWNGGL